MKDTSLHKSILEMTEKQEYIEDMKKLQDTGDIEGQHQLADGLLCKFLIELGHKDLVDEFIKVKKWYC